MKNFKPLNAFLLPFALGLASILHGCGGGGGSNTIDGIIDANKVPKIAISGTTPIRDGLIRITSASGDLMATADTESNGDYNIELEVPDDIIINIRAESTGGSTIMCEATNCPGGSQSGQVIPNDEQLEFTNYLYLESPGEWQTSQESANLSYLSSLASLFIERAIDAKNLRAGNTTDAEFAELSALASKVLQLVINDASSEGNNFLKIEIPELNNSFSTAANRELGVINASLSAISGTDQTAYDELSGWLEILARTEDVLNDNEGMATLVLLGNSQSARRENLLELLMQNPQTQDLPNSVLVTLSQTFGEIDVFEFLELLNDINS